MLYKRALEEDPNDLRGRSSLDWPVGLKGRNGKLDGPMADIESKNGLQNGCEGAQLVKATQLGVNARLGFIN